jgi:superfamily II DNA or RNA helicase
MADERPKLTAQERLALQQLRQVQHWEARTDIGALVNGASATFSELPDLWELTRGLALRDWQQQCVEAWFANGHKGIVKVVTGAGKTVLALAIAERLQHQSSALRVAVVVPTMVLQDQWYEELKSRSNLPPAAIGLMGGGYADEFDAKKRVLICVLNSAAQKLATVVERAGVGQTLLLVVDECHRAGAKTMRQVFRTPRAFSLGLSATPERDEEADEDDEASFDGALVEFDDSVLGRELGKVVFELSYSEAVTRGILPEFAIEHYGLSLTEQERERYERVSREIKDLRANLESGDRRGLALIRWCRKVSQRNPAAARLISLTTERKRLLYKVQQRGAAVVRLLNDAFKVTPGTRAILFHESIDEVMNLFMLLRANRLPVVAEHSQMPDEMRAETLRLFRQGIAQIIVSARSLIEGFNVPAADLGVIVAASSSVRQRIQTLGRLLRRHDEHGVEKRPRLCVLYAKDTADEFLYEKVDWEQFVGAERNEYFVWTSVENSQPERRAEPPRRMLPGEDDINEIELQAGEAYPGNPDHGLQYSVDTQGTVRDQAGRLVRRHAKLTEVLQRFLKGGGRFRVTPKKLLILKLEKGVDEWRAIYLGRLSSALEVINADDLSEAGPDASALRPGSSYPLSAVRGKVFSVLQRDGRLIAKKKGRNVQFVVPSADIAETDKRDKLEGIQRHLAAVISNNKSINKITITPEGYVVYLIDGNAYFAGFAPEGAEGFTFEGSVS